MKVHPSKEETPAHSRHPLPPIFLSPSSSRYLKVVAITYRWRTSLNEDISGAEDGNSSEPMEEEGGHVATAGVSIQKEEIAYESWKLANLKGAIVNFCCSGPSPGCQVQ